MSGHLNIENWKTQIRKGYLEVCILLTIKQCGKIYGFDLLQMLNEGELTLKEGTLYPLLHRMSADDLLSTEWVTEDIKGHPRKFYSLTKKGEKTLSEMVQEFEKLIEIFKSIQSKGRFREKRSTNRTIST